MDALYAIIISFAVICIILQAFACLLRIILEIKLRRARSRIRPEDLESSEDERADTSPFDWLVSATLAWMSQEENVIPKSSITYRRFRLDISHLISSD